MDSVRAFHRRTFASLSIRNYRLYAIGQGISGFSTLALGSILTFVAIVAGSAATMKYQYWRAT